MQSSAPAQPDEAAQTLESVRAAREAADRRLASNWFALVVVGGLLFVSSFLFSVWDGAAVALFWLAVTPLALFAVKRHQRSRLRAEGAVRDPRAGVLVAGGFIAACVVFGTVGGAIGEPALINTGPLLGIAAVYAFLAWRDRSASFVAWSVGVAVVTVAIVLIGMEDPARFVALGIGGGMALDGFRERNKAPV
ncbi:MAG: hypothetical protein ACR2LK_09560 [Solirubrobacteraceae bacterium]